MKSLKTKKRKLEDIGLSNYIVKIYKSFQEIKIESLNIKYGTSLTDKNRIKGKFPLYASNGISDYVDRSNSRNAIVFGCRGTLGSVFFSHGNAFILNTAFFIDNPENYGNLYFALKYEKGLTLYSSGAAQPQITIASIKDAILKTPNDNGLNKILDLIVHYEQVISNLKRIKDLLLNKYFTN